MLSATTFQGYKKCCMLAMDVWCFSKSTIRVDLEKHQTRLHYWGNSLCNFEESPLQLWGILLYNKHKLCMPATAPLRHPKECRRRKCNNGEIPHATLRNSICIFEEKVLAKNNPVCPEPGGL